MNRYLLTSGYREKRLMDQTWEDVDFVMGENLVPYDFDKSAYDFLIEVNEYEIDYVISYEIFSSDRNRADCIVNVIIEVGEVGESLLALIMASSLPLYKEHVKFLEKEEWYELTCNTII